MNRPGVSTANNSSGVVANAGRIRIDDSSPLSGPVFGLKPSDDADIDTLMSVWHEHNED